MVAKITLSTILLLLIHLLQGVESFAECKLRITPTTTKNRNDGRIPYKSASFSQPKQVSSLCRTLVGGLVLPMNNNEDNNENDKGIPFLALAVGISVLLSTWPLLTFFRDVNNPTDGFDVDMFMTLKGIMGGGGLSSDSITSSMLTDENYQTIVELPALSPAEQLVDAVFGPPR